MSLLLLAVLIVVLILVLSKARVILRWIRNRRRTVELIDKLPGPPALPVIGCAYKFSFSSYKFSFTMRAFQREYGDGVDGKGLFRVWIGPVPLVIICRADAAKVILESNEHLSKPAQVYKRLEGWLGQGLLTSSGDHWRFHRKLLTPAFHFQILNGFMHTFNKEARVLADQLERFASTKETFDIYPLIRLMTLDVISETAMGYPLQAQQGESKKYVEAVYELCAMIWSRERQPWMWPELIWKLTGNKAAYEKNLAIVKGFTQEVIKKRKAEFKDKHQNGLNNNVSESTGLKSDADDLRMTPTKRLALLDLLLEGQAENRITDEDIRSEVDTFMFEGHDTTASHISYTLAILGEHPEYQEQVAQEIFDVLGTEQRDITMNDLTAMPILEKVMKEALRVYPPAPMVARSLHEDVDICGYTIPADVTVIVAPYGTHRDPKYYETPYEFNPSHFEPEKCAARNPFAYIPFSAGPRNCIGQKFAHLEAKTAIVTLIRRYKLTSLIPLANNPGFTQLVLRPYHGIQLKIQQRRFSSLSQF